MLVIRLMDCLTDPACRVDDMLPLAACQNPVTHASGAAGNESNDWCPKPLSYAGHKPQKPLMPGQIHTHIVKHSVKIQ